MSHKSGYHAELASAHMTVERIRPDAPYEHIKVHVRCDASGEPCSAELEIRRRPDKPCVDTECICHKQEAFIQDQRPETLAAFQAAMEELVELHAPTKATATTH